MKGIVYVVVGFLLGAISVSAGGSMFGRWQFWVLLALCVVLVVIVDRISEKWHQ